MPIFLSNMKQLRKITIELQEDGRRMMDLYSAEKKRAPSEEGALKRFNIISWHEPTKRFCTLVGTGGKGEGQNHWFPQTTPVL